MSKEKMLLVIGDKNYSSWSMRPWLALRAAGIPFKEEQILLDFPNTSERIHKFSPAGRVPILHHGKLKVWDSLAICEYAAEISDYKLWPEKEEARAHARCVVAEMHSGFATLREQLSMDIRLSMKKGHLLPGTIKDIQRIIEIWKDCIKSYKGPFLFGKQFTIADAFYTPVVMRFHSYGVEIKNKEAKRYMRTILNYPHVKEWIAAALVEKNAKQSF